MMKTFNWALIEGGKNSKLVFDIEVDGNCFMNNEDSPIPSKDIGCETTFKFRKDGTYNEAIMECEFDNIKSKIKVISFETNENDFMNNKTKGNG